MLLVLDNYDSFTYNLVQYLGELGESPVVKRNDEITVDDIGEMGVTRMVISPGPCTPTEAGITVRHPALGEDHSHAWSVSWPPGNRRGVRRQGRSRAHADARQDFADHPRR